MKGIRPESWILGLFKTVGSIFLGFPIFYKKSETQISKLKMLAAILKNHLNINL